MSKLSSESAAMRRKRKSCQQYMAERAAANRDRQIQEVFSELEREALIERLSKDAAQREREKQ